MRSFKFLLMYLCCLFSIHCHATWTISEPNLISETYSFTYGAVCPASDPTTGNYLATWVDGNNNSFPTYALFTPGTGWSAINTISNSFTALTQSNVISSCNPSTGQFLASWTSLISGDPSTQDPTVSLYTPGTGWGLPVSLLTSQANHNTTNTLDSLTGQFLVTWADLNNNNFPTYAFFDPISGWGSVQIISDISPTTDIYTCFNSTTNQFLAVWTDNNTGVVTYSFYSAGSWSAIGNIPGSSVDANVCCACNPTTGQFIATWNDINQSLNPYYSVYTPGSGWSSMLPITTLDAVNGNVTISCDLTTGDFLALWSSAIPNGNLTYSFYNPTSGWTPPQIISNIASTSGDIFSAFNSSTNQFLTTWADSSSFIDDPSYAFFTFNSPTQAPLITTINPSFGFERHCKQTVVTITGANFTGTTEVLFGSTPAISFIVESDSSISAIAPPGHGVVDVRVVSPGGESLITPNDSFTYLPSSPCHLRGKGRRFFSHGHLVFENILKWQAPSYHKPVAYRIYRDAALTDLAGEVNATQPLEFYDEVHQDPRIPITYYVVSVNVYGIQSLPAVTTIKWH